MSSSFPLDGMRVRFAGDSNVGMKRAHNEDSFYLPESERLAIVADGMSPESGLPSPQPSPASGRGRKIRSGPLSRLRERVRADESPQNI